MSRISVENFPQKKMYTRVQRRGFKTQSGCYTYMHGNNTISLFSYLYLKLAKTVSLFMFYGFSSTKPENRKANRFCIWSRRWGRGEERGRRLNMVQIMYTHVCKWKNDIC
jgi:hypothetical protein